MIKTTKKNAICRSKISGLPFFFYYFENGIINPKFYAFYKNIGTENLTFTKWFFSLMVSTYGNVYSLWFPQTNLFRSSKVEFIKELIDQ